MRHVVIAGGGTGGHLFPGIAVAEELKRRFPRLGVTFVGTPKGLENRLLPPLGYQLELLKVTPLQGSSTGRTRSELGEASRGAVGGRGSLEAYPSPMLSSASEGTPRGRFSRRRRRSV